MELGKQIHAYFKDNSQVEIVKLGITESEATYQEMIFPNFIAMAREHW